MDEFDYKNIKTYYDQSYWDTPGVKSGYVDMSRSIGGAWHAQACGWFNAVIPVKDRALLDAGCGLGHFMKGFADLGARVVGCDVCDYCIRFIEANVRLPVIQTALEDMYQVANNTFDLVYCGATLEHIPDELVPDVLYNFARVTRPGGLVFLEIDTKPDDQRSMPEESHVNIKPWPAWLKDLSQQGLPWIVREDLGDALYSCRTFPGFPLPEWSFTVMERIGT